MGQTAQLNLLDEIIADNFAGGGGASTGIELATGRPVTIAVNHDPDAILMHRTNHPYTTHYCESVWDIDPKKVCAGRPVGLAWFSPDCKHFSKAKGGTPVSKNIRGLAWVVLRWAGTVKPRVIILENVEEFQTWGPVRHGRPLKRRAGETFRQWKGQLASLGYRIEHRELVAADYGAPTIRKRFFLIARCDGKPIVWPEPTHAPVGSAEVLEGRKKPWRAVAEVIDWTLPCPSIFDSKEAVKARYGLSAVRPLAENTLRRVARGVDKFVIKNQSPFLVPIGYGERAGQLPRVHGAGEPIPTTTSRGKHFVCAPSIVQVNHTGEFRGQAAGQPLQTVTGKLGYGIAAPVMAPLTATNTSNSVGAPADMPVHTVTSAGNQILLAPSLMQYHQEQGEYVRGQAADRPVMTVDAANRYGIVAPVITKYYGGDGHGQRAEDPAHTVTARDREALAVSFLEVHHAGGYHGKGNAPDKPLNTVTASGGLSINLAHVVKFKGADLGHGADLGRWPEVRGLLNRYCGYAMGSDEVLILELGGVGYYIADIGLRMLTPRELYAANGFPPDYIIERDYLGREYGKSKQVARCGNAVPPPFATALVRANLPEWCGTTIDTMQELEEVVAV